MPLPTGNEPFAPDTPLTQSGVGSGWTIMLVCCCGHEGALNGYDLVWPKWRGAYTVTPRRLYDLATCQSCRRQALREVWLGPTFRGDPFDLGHARLPAFLLCSLNDAPGERGGVTMAPRLRLVRPEPPPMAPGEFVRTAKLMRPRGWDGSGQRRKKKVEGEA